MVKIIDNAAKDSIVEAIRSAEAKTSGEIRVHLRKKCGEDSLKEAQKIFKKLGMHRTKDKNGVLLFIAQDSHRFAIIGDEGIHRVVGDAFWQETRDGLVRAFSQSRYKEGIMEAVRNIGDKLERYFPVDTHDQNELSDNVTSD